MLKNSTVCVNATLTQFDEVFPSIPSKTLSLSPLQLLASLPLPQCKGQLSSSGTPAVCESAWKDENRGKKAVLRCIWPDTHTHSPALNYGAAALWCVYELSAQIWPGETAELIAADCSEWVAYITAIQREKTKAGIHWTKVEVKFPRIRNNWRKRPLKVSVVFNQPTQYNLAVKCNFWY